MTKGWDKESLRHSAAARFGKAPPYRHTKKAINKMIADNIAEPYTTWSFAELKDERRAIQEKIQKLEREANQYADLENMQMVERNWREIGKLEYELKNIIKAKRIKEDLKKKATLLPIASKIKTATEPELQTLINDLLFKDNPEKTDPELLEIVIRADKAKHFEFLKGYTTWGTKGRWHKLDEDNVLIEVQFKDAKDEAVGETLKQAFSAYNKKVVKEDVLYFRTMPIEETSL